ncbi:GDSL-type esterase/lipase family protein [Paraliomyxa miuraensis]|uniref:GDSL-type esterase/lipase family protein n=1 Tax=Paraliomyxa miuraensis TaxID=376150 RepID=UPI002255061D|nr:GDSL-type esterase/lipase family protein [Paraliomyxa miuraensis]MCX4243419.1 GDSL-type esterase/lipase family protein [Paraliomyxa miuraensis]
MDTPTQGRPAKGLLDDDGRDASYGRTDDETLPRIHPFMLRKVGPAILVIIASLVCVYAVPGLASMRPWVPGDPVPFWNVLGRPFEGEQLQQTEERVAKVDAIVQEALTEAAEPVIVAERPTPVVTEPPPNGGLPAYVPHPDDDKPVEQSIELPTGHELDRYFEALARTDAGLPGALTRAVHWGDSAIGVDGITSAIRKRLQARFGDGGHGFHVVAPPNSSYRHRGVRFEHNGQWSLCFIINKCRGDGHYGLGGTTSRSTGGAESRFSPDPKHSSGHVSRFEVWYAAAPRGGRIKLRVDDQEPVVLETVAEALEDRWHAIDVPDGPHRLTVRAAGGGRARVYGVVLEREGPGVVWDGLSLVGAFTRRMMEFDPDHLRAQLQHRAPELVVLTFGGNDMIRSVSMETYAEEYRKVIQRIRTARPEMDCLVMSPLDHGERRGVRIVSQDVVVPMVEAQRRVAREEGCAFYDTFMAQGGEGSAGRWFRQSPRLVSGDLSHVTMNGQIVIGEMFYRALVEAYVGYRKREANGATGDR